PELFTRSRLDPCERLSRRRRKLRMVVKIVVPRVDGALKDQVPDRSAQRRAASCRHNGVALRYDQGNGRPFLGGRPSYPGRRAGAGANRLASRRSLVTRQTWRRTAAIRSSAEKLESATTTILRLGAHRRT